MSDSQWDFYHPLPNGWVEGNVDNLIIGLWNDRGAFDASINTFPITGGSGTAGAILKGDIWTVSVIATSGPLNGYLIGTNIKALTNTPGQTINNWAIIETGLGYVPANIANPLSQFASTTSAQLAGIISDATGIGAIVLADTPSLITPILGTPTSGNLINCTFPVLNQDTSGTAAKATNIIGGNNTTLLGTIPYQSDINTTTLLLPNTTTTKKFLRELGDGINGTVPTWDIVTAADIGLSNVDNTSDLNKPISSATQTALNNKPYIVNLISDLVTVPSTYTTVIVKDLIRGGVFNWSSSGIIDNGITFNGLTGYWTRQFDNISVNPDWWGAIGDANPSRAVNNTTAIQAAIATNLKVTFSSGTYYHNGLVINISTNHLYIEGAGKLKTYLTCINSGVHNISVSSNSLLINCYVNIKSIGLDGNNTNGCGLYLNGIVWYTLEDLYIIHQGLHGIQFIDTGTISSGAFIGVVRDCKCAANTGDGLYQVATASTNQQNASHIIGGEYQSNANGITIWGINLSIRNSIIEGNIGYGIRIQNFKTSSPIYSASNIVINGNYFEGNPGGHIYVKTQSVTSGVIIGLTITENYGSQNLAGANNSPYVSFKIYASDVQEVRNFLYANNEWNITNGGAMAIADFGNAIGFDSIVSPPFNGGSTDIASVRAQYMSLGFAKFNYVKGRTISGYFFAKGGSGITYSTLLKSDNISVSGSYTMYPAELELDSVLYKIGIPVNTDSTNYSINFSVLFRANTSVGSYLGKPLSPNPSINVVGNGNQNIESNVFWSYCNPGNEAARPGKTRTIVGELDSILQITVTITTPGTYFYLGNPTIYYI